MPDDAAPDDAIADDVTPGDAIPDDAIPGGVTPDNGIRLTTRDASRFPATRVLG